MSDKYDDLDDYEDLSDDDEAGRGRLPDSIRKALVSGLSAVLTTEEGIRNALGDMRMPKEALAYLAQQTERTRRELFGAVGDEVRGFLKGVDVTGEFRKALTGLKVQIKAEVTFSEAGASVDAAAARIDDVAEVKEVTEVAPKKKKKKPRKRTARRKKASKA